MSLNSILLRYCLNVCVSKDPRFELAQKRTSRSLPLGTYTKKVLKLLSNISRARFKNEILGALIDGKLKVYIHKVRFSTKISDSVMLKGEQVYPWTEIQDAHKEMQADKNM